MERPTFTREDPDIAPSNEANEKSNHDSTSPAESLSKNEKDRVFTTSTDLPTYVDEERQDGNVKPLETAEDIVTTVIDLEDDPNLNPWTFRMFFIGTYFTTTRALVLIIFQVLVWHALELYWRRSSLSSPRLSSSPSCS